MNKLRLSDGLFSLYSTIPGIRAIRLFQNNNNFENIDEYYNILNPLFKQYTKFNIKNINIYCPNFSSLEFTHKVVRPLFGHIDDSILQKMKNSEIGAQKNLKEEMDKYAEYARSIYQFKKKKKNREKVKKDIQIVNNEITLSNDPSLNSVINYSLDRQYVDNVSTLTKPFIRIVFGINFSLDREFLNKIKENIEYIDGFKFNIDYNWIRDKQYNFTVNSIYNVQFFKPPPYVQLMWTIAQITNIYENIINDTKPIYFDELNIDDDLGESIVLNELFKKERPKYSSELIESNKSIETISNQDLLSFGDLHSFIQEFKIEYYGIYLYFQKGVENGDILSKEYYILREFLSSRELIKIFEKNGIVITSPHYFENYTRISNIENKGICTVPSLYEGNKEILKKFYLSSNEMLLIDNDNITLANHGAIDALVNNREIDTIVSNREIKTLSNNREIETIIKPTTHIPFAYYIINELINKYYIYICISPMHFQNAHTVEFISDYFTTIDHKIILSSTSGKYYVPSEFFQAFFEFNYKSFLHYNLNYQLFKLNRESSAIRDKFRSVDSRAIYALCQYIYVLREKQGLMNNIEIEDYHWKFGINYGLLFPKQPLMY